MASRARAALAVALLASSAASLSAPMAPASAVAPVNVADLTQGSWTVPDGVEVVQLTAIGAKGGTAAGNRLVGAGCEAYGSVPVSTGQVVAGIVGRPGGDGLTSGGTGGFAFAGGTGGAGAFPGGDGGRGKGGTSTTDRTSSFSGGGGGGGASGVTVDGVWKVVGGGGGGAGPYNANYPTYSCVHQASVQPKVEFGAGGVLDANGITQFGGNLTVSGMKITDGGYTTGTNNINSACGLESGKDYGGVGGNGFPFDHPTSPGKGGRGADSGWTFVAPVCGTKSFVDRKPGSGGGGGWNGAGGGASGSYSNTGGVGLTGSSLAPDSPTENAYFAPGFKFGVYSTPAIKVKWATIDTDDAVLNNAVGGSSLDVTLTATFGDGTPYKTARDAFNTSNFDTARWKWTATDLPSGITLNASTGKLTGTVPVVGGDFTVTATYEINSWSKTNTTVNYRTVARTHRTYRLGPSVPTVNVAVDAKSITYGDPTPAITTSGYTGPWVTEPICGVYTKASPPVLMTADPLPAGSYDMTCTGGDTGTGEVVTHTSATITVAQADTTIVYAGMTGAVRVYTNGGAFPAGDNVALEAVVSPRACTTPVQFDMYYPAYHYSTNNQPDMFSVGETRTAQASSPTSAVMGTGDATAGYYILGEWRVKAKYLGDANCKPATSALATFTIVKAGARVTPSPTSQKIEYGNAAPTFTPSTVFETTGDYWDTTPACAIYTQQGGPAPADPIPPGAYVVKCAGGVAHSGDPVEYTNDPFIVEPAKPTLTYTGTTGPIDAGDPLTLSSTLSKNVCTGTPTYAIAAPDGTASPAVSPVSTRRWAPGTYTITMTYAGDANCLPASGTQTVTVNAVEVTATATPGSTTITYGAPTPPFGPTTSGFLDYNGDPDTWVVRPSCSVRDSLGDPITTSPLPVDTYVVRCSDGNPGTGYTTNYVDGSLTVTQATVGLAYTGTTGVIAPGQTVTLSTSLSPSLCSGTVTYTLTTPNNTTETVTPPLDTSAWTGGIYTITATYADDENCNGASDSAALIVGSPGDSTTGGGWYKIDPSISGSARVNFGHTVQKSVQTDKRTGSVTTIYRGQVLWTNSQAWRLKGTVYSRTVDTNGVVTGDAPAFMKIGCPSPSLWPSGATPNCGLIRGTGILEYYDAEQGSWSVATDVGDNGFVVFSVTIYDGGQIKTCKNKICTTTDQTDYFGMLVPSVSTSVGVASTKPTALSNSKNGQIVIRSY